MKILIDIGHPAHVHYFRNVANILMRNGSEVLFTTRDKEVSIQLLEHYGYRFVSFGRPFRGMLGKAWGLFWFTLRLFMVAVRFKPDIYLNATQYSAMVAWLLRKPHISIEDTYNFEQVRLYMPFTSVVLTGSYPHPELGKKEVRYDSYQELAYLHPRYFDPDPNIKRDMGIGENERIVLLRFVSWRATHDTGHNGISAMSKRKMVEVYSRQARVLISSEMEDLYEFEPLRLRIPPEKMHHVLVCCDLLVGESFTMASECAILGVPAIVIHNTRSYYLREEEEKYGLVFNFTESAEDQEKAILKGLDLLQTPKIRDEWQHRREALLKDKIDPTAFFVWFIENYPDSFRIMREHPEYQYRFR